ncbi:MAG: sigma-70 family RNA polymerase sigma factor [Gemmatimonadota bacterium]
MNYTDLSDRELARHSLDGDERAARELVERFRRPVFSLVYRMVQDRELAEDLAQEAFVRAFDALDSYDPSYKFSSWLFKIGHNLTIDHLRKGKLDTVSIHGAPDATSQEEQEATRVTLESREERPDQYTESQLLGEEIERAVADLRPEYREAVLLRHVQGYAYDEIAEIMDVPLGTVKTYIHRARKELRQELAHLRE